MNFFCCLKLGTGKKYAPDESKKEKRVRNYHVIANENEQSENPIAVAAATAAAADVAIVAAQSTLRVARLASMRKDFSVHLHFKYSAAVKIQSAFRAHLARKAFRALKGLVKLQAMAKGSLVRKKTALTFQSMQALIRAQSSLKSETSPVFLYNNNNVKSQPSLYHRRSLENDRSTSTIDVDSCSVSFSTPLPKIRVSDYDSIMSKSRRIHRGRSSMSTNNTPKYVNYWDDSSPSYHPNYMASTLSFEAKVRSLSTPRQRPEICEGLMMKKRVSFNEKTSSRESLKSVVVDRLDKSLQLSREAWFRSNHGDNNRSEVKV